MSQLSLLEKLELSSEKNLLIQGLPSSIEKQFIKISYSKNVTPLLKLKKIEFALVFAINTSQLNSILSDVIPALHKNGRLWVAYPKSTSKITSDLNRDCNWEILTSNDFESVSEVVLDHCWSALYFKKQEQSNGTVKVKKASANVNPVDIKGVDFDKKLVVAPEELERIFNGHKKAREVFQNLSYCDQVEYVEWIEGAKRKDTRSRRLEATVEKLLAGKKTPSEK